MKKYFIGFVLGVLLTLPIGIFADAISNIGKKIDSEFVVKLDGAELPVKAIGIDGTSYAPLRATGEALGLEVDFVDRTVIMESKKEGDNVVKETTFNGMRAVVVNGETYFSPKDYNDIYATGTIVNIGYDPESKMSYYSIKESADISNEVDRYEIGSVDDPQITVFHNGETYINIKYYREPSDFE